MKKIRKENFGGKNVQVYSVKMATEDLCISTSEEANLLFINNKFYEIIKISVEKIIFATVEFIDLTQNIDDIVKRIKAKRKEYDSQIKWINKNLKTELK